MAIETDKFGLTDDQKMRLTSVGLTKEEIKMVNDTRISKEIAEARAQLDKLESKLGNGFVKPERTDTARTTSKTDLNAEAEAGDESISKLIPNAPKIVATFINQRIGSPADGFTIPSGVISKLDSYFASNPEVKKTLDGIVKDVDLKTVDFAEDLPFASEDQIQQSGVDVSTSAFITEQIVNAMKNAGITDEKLTVNKFLD